MTTQRFLVIASFADSLVGFRGPLIKALQAKGFQVHVAAPSLGVDSPLRAVLEAQGLIVHDIALQRTGLNPFADLKSVWKIYAVMRSTRSDYMLAYTIKPVIYGSLAACMARVPHRYALITGLGYAYSGESTGLRGFIQWITRQLYRVALSKVHKVFFQNPDDSALFRHFRLLPDSVPDVVVNGSGVDVSTFSVKSFPLPNINFLLIGRLLGGKGVREYAQAAAIVKNRHSSARFSLVGWIDEGPDAISQFELDAWVASGTLSYLGRLTDVRPALENCSVYVLPSYREGTPRTVLEAMAMGRAIITTDAPGCRETVVDGDNGYLVPVKSVDQLAAAMLRFIEAPELAARMGIRSRQIAEKKYDVNQVNASMLLEMGIQ